MAKVKLSKFELTTDAGQTIEMSADEAIEVRDALNTLLPPASVSTTLSPAFRGMDIHTLPAESPLPPIPDGGQP